MSVGVNGNKPVDQVTVGVPAVHGVAKQPIVQVTDTIAPGKKSSVLATVGQKISAVWNWIKETVASIFKSIFCCFYSKSAKATESQPLNLKQQLIQDKALFEKLHTEFIVKREADKSESKADLKAWWKDMFTRLPQRIQDRVVKADMKADAEMYGLKGTEITKYIDEHFNSLKDKNKTLGFIHDFIQIGLVPDYLEEIAMEISKGIDKATAAELVKKG